MGISEVLNQTKAMVVHAYQQTHSAVSGARNWTTTHASDTMLVVREKTSNMMKGAREAADVALAMAQLTDLGQKSTQLWTDTKQKWNEVNPTEKSRIKTGSGIAAVIMLLSCTVFDRAWLPVTIVSSGLLVMYPCSWALDGVAKRRPPPEPPLPLDNPDEAPLNDDGLNVLLNSEN